LFIDGTKCKCGRPLKFLNKRVGANLVTGGDVWKKYKVCFKCHLITRFCRCKSINYLVVTKEVESEIKRREYLRNIKFERDQARIRRRFELD
jgi:hypothetical protein